MKILQRHIITLIVLLLFTSFSNGQTLTPFKSLKRGYLLWQYPSLFKYDNTHTDSAAYYFDYFLKNVDEKDQNYGLGIVYTAYYYFEKKSFAKAESLFKLFLNIKQPEKYEEISIEDHFRPSTDPNSYFNFVYESLYDIKFRQQKYIEALNYINLAEKSQFKRACGKANMSRGPSLADKKAKCYLELNQKDSALIILLPHIFNEDYTEYNDLIKTTARLLKDKNKKTTKEIVEKAFREMKNEIVENGGTSYKKYFIEINKVNIRVPPPNTDENKEVDYINYVWNSDFYKLIVK